jgi:hypothetical protein
VLGAYVAPRDGCDAARPAVAVYALHAAVFCIDGVGGAGNGGGGGNSGGGAADNDTPSGGSFSRVITGAGRGASNVLNMKPMAGAYDGAPLAPRFGADGVLRIKAVVKALG